MRTQSSSIMSINSVLPHDIIHLILSKLPIPNLPTSRIVCKDWNHMVLNTSKFAVPNTFFVFTRSINSSYSCYNLILDCIDLNNPKHCHNNNNIVSFRFDDVCRHTRFVNSCNGLFLVRRRFYVGILNPFTNEYLEVPEDHECCHEIYDYGFGFSPNTKEYKVFRFSYDDDDDCIILEVLKLSDNNKWSRVNSYNYTILRNKNHIYFNGALYWVGVRPKYDEFRGSFGC